MGLASPKPKPNQVRGAKHFYLAAPWEADRMYPLTQTLTLTPTPTLTLTLTLTPTLTLTRRTGCTRRRSVSTGHACEASRTTIGPPLTLTLTLTLTNPNPN